MGRVFEQRCYAVLIAFLYCGYKNDIRTEFKRNGKRQCWEGLNGGCSGVGCEHVGDEEYAACDEDEVGGVGVAAGVVDGVVDVFEGLAVDAELVCGGMKFADGQASLYAGLAEAPDGRLPEVLGVELRMEIGEDFVVVLVGDAAVDDVQPFEVQPCEAEHHCVDAVEVVGCFADGKRLSAYDLPASHQVCVVDDAVESASEGCAVDLQRCGLAQLLYGLADGGDVPHLVGSDEARC